MILHPDIDVPEDEIDNLKELIEPFAVPYVARVQGIAEESRDDLLQLVTTISASVIAGMAAAQEKAEAEGEDLMEMEIDVRLNGDEDANQIAKSVIDKATCEEN